MATRKQHVQEIIKCGKDPNYFFETYVKIQHPVKGMIPFKMYDFQKDCVEDFKDHRFNIVLKSRQQGLSTLAAAYSVWLAIFKKNRIFLLLQLSLRLLKILLLKQNRCLDLYQSG